MEHEADFDRLTEEIDDYHALLRYGHTSRELVDPEPWRAEIRRQARRDKLPMRTFVRSRTGAGLYHVVALLVRDRSFEDLERGMSSLGAQREAAEIATLRGHSVEWIRVHDGKAAGRCSSCGGRVYVDARNEPRVIEGDVFDGPCVG